MSRWADEFEAEISARTPCANSANSANSPQIRPFGTIGPIGTGKSDEYSELDRVRVPSPFEPDKRPEWDSETRQLIDWFSATIPQAEPFELCKGVTILDPARWWQSINGDIASGPNGPRARYGAVQGDLRRLYQRFCEADDQQSKAVRDD